MPDLTEVVKKIIDLSPKMRFVGIIDLRGNIVEGIMKKGKTSLESQREQEHFCQQIAERRRMRGGFNRSLGKVTYVHVERERVSQLVVYAQRRTIFVTVEPDMPIASKMKIVARIQGIAAKL